MTQEYPLVVNDQHPYINGTAVRSRRCTSLTVVSDGPLRGAIGVVFTLVTWFIAMGAVIILGAVVGHPVVIRRGGRMKASARTRP
jgi:hypothetical protein